MWCAVAHLYWTSGSGNGLGYRGDKYQQSFTSFKQFYIFCFVFILSNLHKSIVCYELKLINDLCPKFCGGQCGSRWDKCVP